MEQVFSTRAWVEKSSHAKLVRWEDLMSVFRHVLRVSNVGTWYGHIFATTRSHVLLVDLRPSHSLAFCRTCVCVFDTDLVHAVCLALLSDTTPLSTHVRLVLRVGLLLSPSLVPQPQPLLLRSFTSDNLKNAPPPPRHTHVHGKSDKKTRDKLNICCWIG